MFLCVHGGSSEACISLSRGRAIQGCGHGPGRLVVGRPARSDHLRQLCSRAVANPRHRSQVLPVTQRDAHCVVVRGSNTCVALVVRGDSSSHWSVAAGAQHSGPSAHRPKHSSSLPTVGPGERGFIQAKLRRRFVGTHEKGGEMIDVGISLIR